MSLAAAGLLAVTLPSAGHAAGGGGNTSPGGSSTQMNNSRMNVPPAAASGSQMGSMDTASTLDRSKAKELLGADVKNAKNETIGQVDAVKLDQSGKVSSVIVSVGGFLGIGDRNVALSSSDVQLAENGNAITTDKTKDQLKNMPEYRYQDDSQSGSVFQGG